MTTSMALTMYFEGSLRIEGFSSIRAFNNCELMNYQNNAIISENMRKCCQLCVKMQRKCLFLLKKKYQLHLVIFVMQKAGIQMS